MLPTRKTYPESRGAFPGVLFLASLALAGGGCGLADYEKRLDEQKAFLQLFDEEKKALGAPLDPPIRLVKDQKTVKIEVLLPVEFFLRPPQGTSAKVRDKEGRFGVQNVGLFRYAGPPGYNVLVSTALLPQEKKDPRLKKEGQIPAREFQNQVRGALMDFYQKEYQKGVSWAGTDFEKTQKITRSIPNPRGQPLLATFEAQALIDQPGAQDASAFYLYFAQGPGVQGVVIYQVPAEKSRDPALTRALEFSLNSFGLALEARKKLQDYRKIRRTG